jgi:hypothetical protein
MTDLFVPGPESPLLDAVTVGCTTGRLDQRGLARPQGEAKRCDAGAVEREVPVVTGSTDDDDDDGDGNGESPVTTTGTVPPVPNRIPAGDGGCADGCPGLTPGLTVGLTVGAGAPARRR